MFRIIFLIPFVIFVVGCSDSSDPASDNNSTDIATSVESVDSNVSIDGNNTSELDSVIEDIEIVLDENLTFVDENLTFIDENLTSIEEVNISIVVNEVNTSNIIEVSDNIVLPQMTDEKLSTYTRTVQTKIAQKILSTLYKGMNVNEIDKLLDSGTFISHIKDKINNRKLDPSEMDDVVTKVKSHYFRNRALQEPLAMIAYIPLSKDYINLITAYRLMQSILYSGAYELDTVGQDEVINLFEMLFSGLKEGKTIEEIVYDYLDSLAIALRFPASENRTREIMEIFLMIFNDLLAEEDQLVPITSKLCQNYQINNSTKKLVIDPFYENTETLTLFGKQVRTCDDFHKAVVDHPDLTKVQIIRLVDVFFPNSSLEQKDLVIDKILESNPEGYQYIIKQIIFSDEYLLRTDNYKSIEETAFPFAGITDFTFYKNFFYYFEDKFRYMGQRTNTYKLGRSNSTPIDPRNFQIHRNTNRDMLVRDTLSNQLNENDGGWGIDFLNSLDNSSERAFVNDISRNFTGGVLSDLEFEIMEFQLGDKLDISTISYKTKLIKIVLDYLLYMKTDYYQFEKLGEE
ncbi:hypothetical protein ACFLY2_02465 [Patescibacteria group bacterium]